MDLVSNRIPANAQAALQTSNFVRLVPSPALDTGFYQWLLLRARAGVQVEILVAGPGADANLNLTPQYFQRLVQAGGSLYILSGQSIPLPFILLDSAALIPENSQPSATFRLEENPATLHKLRSLFEQMKEQGLMPSGGVIPGVKGNPNGPEQAIQQPSNTAEAINIRFYATPRAVGINERFELSWSVEGARQVEIQPLLGAVPPKGSRVLSAEKSVEFCLTASNGTQTLSNIVKVAVDPNPKIEYLLTAPGRNEKEDVVLQAPSDHPDRYGVMKGQVLRLYWRVYNAVEINLDGQPKPPNGSVVLAPDRLTAYTLSASGNNTTVHQTIVVDVFPNPEIEQLSLADTGSLPANLSATDPVPLAIPVKPDRSVYPATDNRDAGAGFTTTPPPWPGLPSQHGVRDFFWFCSGASRDMLLRCPAAEGNKYAGIGATVFFTGLLAALSGGYALYVAFQSLPGAVFFGLLWGAAIFNLDRLIVSTIKKEATPGRQWRQALPRLLLALVLSVVIAKPLELRIFKPEIDELLSDKQTEKLLRTETRFREKAGAVEARIAQLKAETAASLQARETLYQEYRCECDGTCGTGKVGRGTECERKEAKYRQADREYQVLKTENDRLITAARTEADGIKKQALTAVQEVKSVHADGLVARLAAAGDLPFWPGFFIALLILMVEIAPVLSKILAPAGAYDQALRVEEARFTITQEELLQQQQQESQRNADLRVRLHQAEIDLHVEQKREIMRLIAGAQVQLAQDRVEQWLEGERKKAKKGDLEM